MQRAQVRRHRTATSTKQTHKKKRKKKKSTRHYPRRADVKQQGHRHGLATGSHPEVSETPHQVSDHSITQLRPLRSARHFEDPLPLSSHTRRNRPTGVPSLSHAFLRRRSPAIMADPSDALTPRAIPQPVIGRDVTDALPAATPLGEMRHVTWRAPCFWFCSGWLGARNAGK